jgi:Protein of unknown function (DUF732)
MNYPPVGPPGPPPQWQPPQPPQPPPRKSWPARHKVWTAIFSVVGLFVVLGIIGAIVGNPKSAGNATGPTGSPSAQVASSTLPSPVATLTAGQAKFVSAVRAALAAKGFSNSSTDAQLVSVGMQVCSARQSGSSQATIVSASAGIPARLSMSPKQFVRAAEKDLCPQYLPKPPVVLLTLSGNGIQNSGPVVVTQSSLTVHYSSDCSSFGGSGNFIADFQTANQASLNSDDQQIANALGPGGSATTTIYPQNQGAEYHLAVNSECNWSVTITAPSS